MISGLMEIMDDMQEQIGNVYRDKNSKKELKGKSKKWKIKQENKNKEFFVGGTLSLQCKCVRKKNQQLCRAVKNLLNWNAKLRTEIKSFGTIKKGFPWWLSAKRIPLPMQGTWVWTLIREDPTCHGATKQVHHSYWACALRVWELCALEPVLRNKRSHFNKKPKHCN